LVLEVWRRGVTAGNEKPGSIVIRLHLAVPWCSRVGAFDPPCAADRALHNPDATRSGRARRPAAQICRFRRGTTGSPWFSNRLRSTACSTTGRAWIDEQLGFLFPAAATFASVLHRTVCRGRGWVETRASILSKHALQIGTFNVSTSERLRKLQPALAFCSEAQFHHCGSSSSPASEPWGREETSPLGAATWVGVPVPLSPSRFPRVFWFWARRPRADRCKQARSVTPVFVLSPCYEVSRASCCGRTRPIGRLGKGRDMIASTRSRPT